MRKISHNPVFLNPVSFIHPLCPGEHQEFFVGGVGGLAETEATYSLCLILKTML
jgi:hypothetical protein